MMSGVYLETGPQRKREKIFPQLIYSLLLLSQTLMS